METKNGVKVLVLAGDRVEEKTIENISNKLEARCEKAQTANECLLKLEVGQYDALVIDSEYLMLGDELNTYYIRTICELTQVIVVGSNKNKEIEDLIRAERIFYFILGPALESELALTLEQAAKWNAVSKKKQASIHERRLIPGIVKQVILLTAFIALLGGLAQARELVVSVSPFRNLTGNTCNDWIGAGFASALITSMQGLSGVRIVEETEMGKLIESMKFGMSGFVDESTLPEKGRIIGAKYSLVGSIQLFNDKAVTCYRLMNMETGEIVFGNTVQGKTKKLMALEEAVGRDVVKQFEKAFPAICLKSGSVKKSSFAKLHGDGAQGLKYSLLSDPDEAVKCYESAIDENPEFADGYLGLGELYARKNQLSTALSKFSRAYELYYRYKDDRFSGWAAYKIGEILFRQSDYASAVAYFNKALQFKKGAKNDFQVLYIYQRLAEIAEIRSDGKRWAEYLKKAVEVSEKLGDVPAKIEAEIQLSRYYNSKDDFKLSSKHTLEAYKLAAKGNYLHKGDIPSGLTAEASAAAEIEKESSSAGVNTAELAEKLEQRNSKLAARNSSLADREQLKDKLAGRAEKISGRADKLTDRGSKISERKKRISDRNTKLSERSVKQLPGACPA